MRSQKILRPNVFVFFCYTSASVSVKIAILLDYSGANDGYKDKKLLKDYKNTKSVFDYNFQKLKIENNN